jgi:IclR family acetate operon transcriptional repressor
VATPRPRRGGTLETGLDVIEALSALPEPAEGVGVTELAAAIGADKANVHRLLGVLQRRGYVIQDRWSRRWSLSVAVVGLAGRVLRSIDVRRVAEPVLRALVADQGETAHLAVATPHGGLYVLQERPEGRVSVETDLGAAPVLHASATGKALLAWLDPTDRGSRLPAALLAHTSATKVDRSALEADLRSVRRRGYAVDDEELQAGVRCVAAPVRGIGGSVVATIGLSGPVERVPKSRIPTLGRAVLCAAGEVTDALGGDGAPGWPSGRASADHEAPGVTSVTSDPDLPSR